MNPLIHIAAGSVLLTFLIALALGIAFQRRLFSAVMLASAFSMTMTILFVLYDAPDVAFTEAAVGAALTSILMLTAMNLAHKREAAAKRLHLPAAIATLCAGCLVFYGALDLPPHGDSNAAVHQHLAPQYLKRAKKDTGAPNVVTAILASYRGFDTLGEVFVIFTAGVAVVTLLARPARRRKQKQ